MGKEITVKDLQNYFNFKSTSLIYLWKKNDCLPSFDNLIKLADYFKVSLDYILGLTESNEVVLPKKLPKFSNHFKKILKQYNSSQYKLIKDGIISNGHLNSWLNLNNMPSVENLIRLADHLNISVDELVGRV